MFRIGVVFGVLLVGYSLVPVPEYVRPLVQEIDLSRANEVQATFETRPGSRYILGIEVDADPTANCLLGAFTPGRSCARPPELDVAWAVYSADSLAVQGEMGQGRHGSADLGSRHILQLATLGSATNSDGSYTVGLSIRSAAPTLAHMNAALVADLGRETVLTPVFQRAFARVGGVLLLAGSLILGLYRRFRAKRSDVDSLAADPSTDVASTRTQIDPPEPGG